MPLLDPHELDVVYQMRERLEPLALTESAAAPDRRPRSRALEDIQERIEADDELAEFLVLDREFHLASLRRLRHRSSWSRTRRRLWNSTQHYRRAFMQLGGPDRRWVVDNEHRLLLDAHPPARPRGRRALPRPATSAAPGSSSASHPEVFRTPR